jgi:hypothetical protein
MQRSGYAQVMRQITNVNVGETAGLKQLVVAGCVPDGNMPLNLVQNSPVAEALHEILAVWRVQVEHAVGFQRTVDRAADPKELIVVDVLDEIERKRGVELISMLSAERDDIAAMVRGVRNPPLNLATPGRTHERVRKIDTDVLDHTITDEVEEEPIAAAEVGHPLMPGELEQRQHAPDAPIGVRIVILDVALVVNRPELFFGSPSATTRGVREGYHRQRPALATAMPS